MTPDFCASSGSFPSTSASRNTIAAAVGRRYENRRPFIRKETTYGTH
jgi:hypothetical protein